ncbi:MAG TPA: NAD(P)H-dependent oxidoreductase [Alteraurantiacibacter sp.]
MNHPLRTGLIYGSTREGRLCDSVAGWVADQARTQERIVLDPIDPLAGDDGMLRGRIDAADAFIVVTPEYNHSFPGPLKSLIDSAKREWEAKPVGFVSYGGISGGLRAVEHLRGVFAELHAVGLRDSVSFANAWDQFDSEGRLRDGARAGRSLSTMLSRLEWWGVALRNARAARAYGEAA